MDSCGCNKNREIAILLRSILDHDFWELSFTYLKLEI